MIAALRQRFSLTPEQRALFRTKRIEGRYTADDLIAKLTPLARSDSLGDKGRNTGCGLLVWLAIGLVANFFIVLFMDLPRVWLFGPAGVLGLLFVAVLIARSMLSGMDDKENYLREVALPFLSALRQDVRPGAQMEVRIDFSPLKQKSKLDRVEKPPLPPGFSKLVNSYYRNPWFTGSAPLAIGGRLEWQVIDLLCDSSRTRRGSSGKYKLKTKSKKKARLDVSLSLPASRYQASDAADPRVAVDGKRIEVTLAQRVATSDSAPGTVVRGVRIGAGSEPKNVVEELIDLVAQSFNKVKPISTPSGATP